MVSNWKIRVDPVDEPPFHYRAILVWGELGIRVNPVPPAALQGKSDLAEYLKECGAIPRDIERLLDRLDEGAVEVPVVPPARLFASLWRR
jgi:hypothetical protein